MLLWWGSVWSVSSDEVCGCHLKGRHSLRCIIHHWKGFFIRISYLMFILLIFTNFRCLLPNIKTPTLPAVHHYAKPVEMSDQLEATIQLANHSHRLITKPSAPWSLFNTKPLQIMKIVSEVVIDVKNMHMLCVSIKSIIIYQCIYSVHDNRS